SRRSQRTASSSPPPRQWPLIAARTGYGCPLIASIASWNGWATNASASVENGSSGMPAMACPGEKSAPAPGTTTQRPSLPRSRRGIVSASAFRMSWARAFRRAGLEIVKRATAGAGWSRTSLPPASSVRSPSASGGMALLEDDEDVALLDRLALLAADLLDRARVLGPDGHLHLHGFEDDDRVAIVNLVAGRDLDLPHGARDVGRDVDRHGAAEYPPCRRRKQATWWPSSPRATRPTGSRPPWAPSRRPSPAPASSSPTTPRATLPPISRWPPGPRW